MIWRMVRRFLLATDSIWTEGHRNALDTFLETAAGQHLVRHLEDHIARESQRVVLTGAKDFECGMVAGQKTLLACIQQMTRAGVAPEDDEIV